MMVARLAKNFNGITMAYVMGLANALLSVLLAFGVTMSLQQQSAVVAFVNAFLVILAHFGHRLGEAQQVTAQAEPVHATVPQPSPEPPAPVTPVAVVPVPPPEPLRAA